MSFAHFFALFINLQIMQITTTTINTSALIFQKYSLAAIFHAQQIASDRNKKSTKLRAFDLRPCIGLTRLNIFLMRDL